MPRPVLVRCSCRRETILRWDGKKMVADDPEWDVARNEKGVIVGWTCGRRTHRQIPLDEMRRR